MATILIVDDLAANRAFLSAVLRHEGHRLVEAADGEEALAVAQAEQPDLVITDVLMPVMDGYEFVRQLRLDPKTIGIPVVFCTAHYGEHEAKTLALSIGVAYVLTKPASSERVLNVVNAALSGQSAVPISADDNAPGFEREHLRLLTDKLSGSAGNLRTADERLRELRTANARLRALLNIGLEIASEPDSEQLLHRVCVAARDLFGATYVTLGILDRHDRTVQRFLTCGADATCVPSSATAGGKAESLSGILGTVVAERRAVRGHAADGNPSGPQFPWLHPEVQAYLAAPIAGPGHVYGWICLVGNEGRPFSDEDEHLLVSLAGKVGRIYELKHEIVQREQAEAAVRRERDRAESYLETADVMLLAFDMEYRITLVNRYACNILGWTSAELLARDWIETCVPARIRSSIREKLHNLLGGDLSIVQNPVLTKSGEERLIEWRNTVLRNDAGQVIGAFTCGTDITERHQAVEALRITEERMRFALESAGVGIWDMDYTTGVLRWSETIEAHYGVPPGTFAGTFDAFVERIHPDDRESVVKTFGQAMKSGSDFTVLNRCIWPDGTIRWLNGAGRILLGARGEPVRGVGISQDVTEHRTLEAQYHQAQKMEAIGRLAAGVAHDFNNLLTAILGYSELLLAELGPNDPRRPDIAEIQKAGVSAAALTRQLLAFSRQEIIEPTVLDLNLVMADVRVMLERLIGEDLDVKLRLDPKLAAVKADRGQVEQIVVNLAVNARDAMPQGGTLTVETANVELDEHYAKMHLAVTPGRYVMLTVSDTGTGITPAVRARLFEPFFTTKGPGKGTGLGLATVHGIITRAGGSINVYTELGKGTSFRVYFPSVEAAETVAEAPPPVPPSNAGSHTVLVVDDAEALRELARRLLERHGYRVLTAANADEALQVFEDDASIELVLTDVVMPGSSGPELAKRLLERRPALKVVYMSGYTRESIVHHGIVDHGIAFLHKPFTSETLARKLNEVLEGYAPASSRAF